MTSGASSICCEPCDALVNQPGTVAPHDALRSARFQTLAAQRRVQFRCNNCGNVLDRPEDDRASATTARLWRFATPPHTCLPNFHHYRSKPARYTLYSRLWHMHDNHPLPPRLNKAAREILYVGRRLKLRIFTPRPKRGCDEYGDPVASRYKYPTPVQLFEPVPLDRVEARFRSIHLANEHLYNGDGSWDPHPYMPHYGSGIPIEEVSERIVGYLDAFKAFGDPVFFERAKEGGRYILERRLFANGHLRLGPHPVAELAYSYAGCALLALWVQDRSETAYLRAATRIADRLVEEHIGGAIDHAVKVAQLLAPLYEITGKESYLKASLRRALRAVALQLPYGGWAGNDSRIWYHCIIGRGLIDTYIATPNTLAYYAKRDHIARSITGALNRVVSAQRADGHIKIGRGDGTKDPLFAEYARFLRHKTAAFTGEGFIPSSMELRDFVPRDPMDFLTAAFEELAVEPAAIAAHGLAHVIVRTSAVHRLEFETYIVGRYARFLQRLAQLNRETVSRVGAQSHHIRAAERPRHPKPVI